MWASRSRHIPNGLLTSFVSRSCQILNHFACLRVDGFSIVAVVPWLRGRTFQLSYDLAFVPSVINAISASRRCWAFALKTPKL